nr:GGDEF domain-containing protein [Synechococcus sp. CCY 9618]
MARVDGLTKVLNHITFMEELANSFSIYRRSPQFGVWVVMLDLDRFKLVNDTYGHAGGDRVLTHFSQLLRQNLRDSDTAGRIGGEEFSVMLRGTDQAGALEFCRRLQEALASHPVRFGEKELAITFSGGCSCFQPQDRSGADALQRADTALYEAKWKGRDQIQVAMTTPP